MDVTQGQGTMETIGSGRLTLDVSGTTAAGLHENTITMKVGGKLSSLGSCQC